MLKILNYPFMVFALSLTVLWASTILGARLAPRLAKDREDLNVVVAATLTLLGLILAFTFSMAVNSYDQRKLYEEEEANAIGTEYVRADLLPPADGETVQKLLRDYLDQRILFYRTRDEAALKRIDAATAQLQQQLWAAVRGPARAQQTTVMALVVAGMNDVLNSQGYTQASWLNRMVGLSWHRLRSTGLLLGMLPLIVSAALKLIADIDSPRGGLIHVEPVNLITLAASLRP